MRLSLSLPVFPNRGFCFFNSVAIAAKQLQQRLNVSKILIVDWVSTFAGPRPGRSHHELPIRSSAPGAKHNPPHHHHHMSFSSFCRFRHPYRCAPSGIGTVTFAYSKHSRTQSYEPSLTPHLCSPHGASKHLAGIMAAAFFYCTSELHAPVKITHVAYRFFCKF